MCIDMCTVKCKLSDSRSFARTTHSHCIIHSNNASKVTQARSQSLYTLDTLEEGGI